MTFDASVAGRLREERDRLGHSQAAMAEAVGVRREMWARYEAGTEPGAGVLIKAIQAGVDVLYVLAGRREPKASTSALLPAPHLAEPPPKWGMAHPARPDATHPPTPATGGDATTGASALLAPADVSLGRPMTLPVRFAAGDTRGYQVIPKCRADASAGRAGARAINDADVQADPAGVLALEVEFMARTLGRSGAGFMTVAVSGDSMEPTLSDGDVIIVDTTRTSVDASGVYVVRIGGDLLVKRVHRRVDGSLVIKGDNPAYEPEHILAPAVASLQVLGRMTRLRLR